MSGATIARIESRRPTGRLVTTALLAAAVAAGPAAAQGERPPERPTRDAAVTYRVVGAGLPEQTEMRMAWQVAENRVRMDFPGGMWVVVDQKGLGESFMVIEPARAVMPMPAGADALPGMPGDPNNPAARYARGGTAAYAGHACTVWRYENDRGGTGEACVTADGVMLRGVGTHEGRTGGMEATQVAYGPQDATRFHRPAGYQEMQAPAVPPGAAAPAR